MSDFGTMSLQERHEAMASEIVRLSSALDEARKATAEFDRMRLLACGEVERLAPLVRESYRIKADLIFLRAECDGAKEREAALRARILEWEDCYDRLAGAFELHMAVLECRQALNDYAGVYYDVLMGARLAELEAARAVGAYLNDRKHWQCGICPTCGFGRKLDGSEFHGSGCVLAAYNDAALKGGEG